MPDYSQGKIYKIISEKINEIYIGSTTMKYLSKRLATHLYQVKFPEKYRMENVNKILKYGDSKIILLEEFPCNTKDELFAREQYWIDKNKNLCINKLNCVPVSEYSKKYGHINKKKKFCLYCGDDVCAGGYKSQHIHTKKHKNNVKIMNKILAE
jgi:GIY-YIG catalytic domain